MRVAREVRRIGAVGAFLAAAAVGLGAFGAHALKSKLDQRAFEIFETAAHYHLLHAVGVLALAALAAGGQSPAKRSSRLVAAGWLLVVGVIVFSGSLYVLAITGVRAFGAVTPIGGVALLAGWATAAWSLLAAGNDN